LVKADPEGDLDQGYGTDGSVSLPTTTVAYWNTVAIASDGEAYPAGWIDDDIPNGVNIDQHFAVEHFDAQGQLDGNYGADGLATFTITANNPPEPFDGTGNGFAQIKLMPDGGLVIVGSVELNSYQQAPSYRDLTVLRADGQLNADFGNDGQIYDDSVTLSAFGGGTAVAVAPENKMIIGICQVDCLGIVEYQNVPQPNQPGDSAQFGNGDGSGDVHTGDPVDPATGNVYMSHTDFTVSAPGLPISWTRSYNSQDDQDGPLGIGWTDPFNVSLSEDGTTGNITIREADGHTSLITYDSDSDTYTPPYGDFDSLVKNGDGSYDLTRRNGVDWKFNTNGQLLSITDRVGNTTSLTYTDGLLTKITDSAGREYDLTYGTGADTGHIIQVSFPGSTILFPRVITYAYTDDHLTSYTDPAGNQTDYSYDTDGRLETVITPGTTNDPGSTTTYSYDDFGRATSVNTDNGPISDDFQDTTYTYDPSQLTTYITDAAGKTSSFDFDDHGNVLQITNPDGDTENFTYNPDTGREMSMTDWHAPGTGGRVTSYQYDAEGDRTGMILPKVSPGDPAHPESDFTYNSYGQLLTATDPKGEETSYTYDGSGRLTEIDRPDGGVTTYTYDPLNNPYGLPASMIDARGKETDYTYDAYGNLASSEAVDEADQPTWNFEYDYASRQTSIQEPLGTAYTTTISYTPDDQVDHITEPSSDGTAPASTISYAYDPRGNLLSSTDENDDTTTYTYSPNNELLSTTDPTGVVTTYDYDDLGNNISKTDGAGDETDYAYDPEQHLSSITQGAGTSSQTVTAYDYNPDGTLASETVDPGTGSHLNQVTDYAYDGLGRLKQTTKYDGATPVISSYAYDLEGNLTTATDPNGNTTTYAYNDLGLLSSKANPVQAANSTPWSYSYDHDGNLTQVTDPNGSVTDNTYDALDQLTDTTYAPATGIAPTPSISRSYDANGNMVSLTDGTGTTSFSYDHRDRMIEADLPEYGGLGSASIAYDYYPNNQVADTYYPGGLSAGDTYDAAGRISTVTDQNANTTSFAYATGSGGNGSLSSITYPGQGGTTDYTYTPLGQAATIDNSSSVLSALDSDLSLSYDPAGNLTSLSDTGDGAIADFTYDSLNRLVDEDWSGIGTGSLDREYGYDPAGNRTSLISDDGTGPIETDNTYNADESLAVSTTGSIETDYSYDADGNRTSKTTDPTGTDQLTSYAYDAANQLIEADLPGTANDQTYAYNGYGNLAAMITDQTGADTSADYTYDPLNDNASSGPILETDDAGSSGNSAFNLRAPGGRLLTRAYQSSGLLSGLTTAAPDAYHLDQSGSPSGLVDTSTGDAVSTAAYGAFGNVINSTGAAPGSPEQPYAYLDRPQLGTTGLDQFNARAYDPNQGSFTSPDPLLGQIEQQALGGYAYALDNPYQYQDITGLFSVPDPVSGIEDSISSAYDTSTGAVSDGFSTAANTLENTTTSVANYTANAASGAWSNLETSASWLGNGGYYLLQEAYKNAIKPVADWVQNHPALALSIVATAACLSTAQAELCLLGSRAVFGATTAENAYDVATGKANIGEAGQGELLAAFGYGVFGEGATGLLTETGSETGLQATIANQPQAAKELILGTSALASSLLDYANSQATVQ